MTWVRFDPDLGDNDCPLHAGICVDVLRGDLLHAATENAYDICVGPPTDPSADTYYHSGTLTKTDYTVGAVQGLAFPVPARPVAGAPTPRSITVQIRCWLSGAGTATVRAYLRGPRTAEGMATDTCYGEVQVTATTPTWYDLTITTPDVGAPLAMDAYPADDLDSMPPDLEESQLVVLAVSTNSRSLRVEAIRLAEGAP
jgi:hypothetical protein